MKTVSFNSFGKWAYRLGNQMFQYATVLGAARWNNHKPIAWLGNVPHMEDCFVLGSVEDRKKYADFLVYMEPENHFGYSEILTKLPEDKNIDLRGYFQTEKHFKHVEQEVRENFTFTELVTIPAAEKIPTDSLCVSVHVRRGDYVNLQNIHPCTPVEYYIEALRHFPTHQPVFFSDDPKWCEEQFSQIKNDPIFIQQEETYTATAREYSDISAYVDMCAMSMCHSHIIANSSFSWWGAWLGGGKTIAPKTWFGPDGPKDWQDIYCEGWYIL